jgi:hypothetical protein
MWEGIAGELGRIGADSCTSRSKIWLPAGDERRGDEVRAARLPGQVGMKCVYSAAGEVVVADARGDEVLGGDLGVSSSSAVFFLPKPKRVRFLAFFAFASIVAASAVVRGVVVPPESESIWGSESLGIGWPLGSGVLLARLMVVGMVG